MDEPKTHLVKARVTKTMYDRVQAAAKKLDAASKKLGGGEIGEAHIVRNALDQYLAAADKAARKVRT